MARYAGRFRVAPCFLAPVVRRGGSGRVLRLLKLAAPVPVDVFPEPIPDVL
jgi:hypothetical protein